MYNNLISTGIVIVALGFLICILYNVSDGKLISLRSFIFIIVSALFVCYILIFCTEIIKICNI